MEIYLIRHTTPMIKKGLIYGRTDVLLADSFTQEKDVVLRQLTVPFDAVYSSPSLRCTQLAAMISPSWLADTALYELNFGDWEGMTWDTIDHRESEIWMEDFVNRSPPGGETMQQLEKRVMEFLDHLLKQPFQNVAVVTHGGVIRTLLARYRSVALKDAFSIPVGMGEVFILSFSIPSH